MPEKRRTRHDVSMFAWPGGKTIYGARCNRCGESWFVRNLKLARARLVIFREEECPAPDALQADQVEVDAQDYWAATEEPEEVEPEEQTAVPNPAPANPRHLRVVMALAIVVACGLAVSSGCWLSNRASQPVAHTVTTDATTGLVDPPGFTGSFAKAKRQLRGLFRQQARKDARWRRAHPQIVRQRHIESALVLELLIRWTKMTPVAKRANVHHYHQCLAAAQNRQDVIGCLRAALADNGG